MGVKEIHSVQEWEQVLQQNTVVFADFFADWCGPCKMIAPKFAELASKEQPGKVAFVKINIDGENVTQIVQKHQIKSLPTFKAFVKGESVGSVEGANPKALEPLIETNLKHAETNGQDEAKAGAS